MRFALSGWPRGVILAHTSANRVSVEWIDGRARGDAAILGVARDLVRRKVGVKIAATGPYILASLATPYQAYYTLREAFADDAKLIASPDFQLPEVATADQRVVY